MFLQIYPLKEIFGILAGIVSFLAYIPYIVSIIKKETRPSHSSWWIWSAIGLMILFSYYSIGARFTIWVPLIFFLCPLIIAIMSIWFGEGQRLNGLDKICIFGTFTSLIPWMIFQSAKITLFINIFVDFLGFLPTIQKTFFNPLYENRTSWILFFLGSTLNVLAIESFSLTIASYPIYMIIMDIVMLSLLYKNKNN